MDSHGKPGKDSQASSDRPADGCYCDGVGFKRSVEGGGVAELFSCTSPVRAWADAADGRSCLGEHRRIRRIIKICSLRDALASHHLS